ncbi:MAG: hypothetical protein IPO01_17580 [Chitinophagaceae bacterium]|nr:hypothetical protein [Chitinophagaceae bacterium]
MVICRNKRFQQEAKCAELGGGNPFCGGGGSAVAASAASAAAVAAVTIRQRRWWRLLWRRRRLQIRHMAAAAAHSARNIQANAARISLGDGQVITYAATSITCDRNSKTFTITVNPPAATISYTGSPYCSNAGTATLPLRNMGGTLHSTQGLTLNNAANGDVTLGTSTPDTFTVTYTIRAAGGYANLYNNHINNY